MAIQDLVVHIDSSQAVEKRLEAAIRLAQTHGAHLTGLYSNNSPKLKYTLWS